VSFKHDSKAWVFVQDVDIKLDSVAADRVDFGTIESEADILERSTSLGEWDRTLTEPTLSFSVQLTL
jgi:hypothetical protein